MSCSCPLCLRWIGDVQALLFILDALLDTCRRTVEEQVECLVGGGIPSQEDAAETGYFFFPLCFLDTLSYSVDR